MKAHTLKSLLISVFLLLFVINSAKSQVVFSALQGNAPTYLPKGSSNQVVFGFSVTVPAFGYFNPGPLHISSSTGLNGFVSGNLVRTTAATPSLAISNALATYGANINGTIDINGFTALSGGTTATTYYFYLVLSITNTANPQPTSVYFSLPASGSISQNGYFGGITVNNSTAASSSYYFTGPTLSYSPSTNVYSVGNTITTLTPTSSNIGTIGGYATGTSFGSGYSGPENVATDPSGNVYVTNVNNNTISKFSSSGTYISAYGTSLNGPYGLSFDASGNGYISNYGSGSIIKITSGGVQSTIATGLTNPFGNVTDAAGNIYVANFGQNTIQKFNSSGTLLTSIVSNGAVNVAVDPSGNIYALSYSNGTVTKYNAAGVLQSTFASGLSTPFGLTIDASGNVYVADSGNNRVLEYNASGTLVATIATGSGTSPRGVAVDASGNLYVTMNANGTVIKYAPTGGFYISQALPAGLSFSSSTGAISGTPTIVSPATTYTVTAFNSVTSGSTTINLTVNNLAPNISYATPQFYNVGTTITPLAPTNTGGAVGSYGAATTYKNVSNSNGVAEDASGNLYVTSNSGNNVTIYGPTGTLITTKGGYNQPAGIIVDAAGNSYVANRGGSNIIKTTPGGVQTTITGAFSQPVGITMDAAGNIYVADYGNSTVFKIAAGTLTPVPYITSIVQPWGIALNSTGDLFVSSLSTKYIYKVPAGITTPAAFVTSGLTSPRNMVFDAAGNMFQADGGSGIINMISPAGVVTNLLTGLDSPVGIALDPSGNLFASGYNFGEVYKSTASGYSIGSTLPAGLNFNNYNGVISGTPTAASPATNYVVTATNSSGTSKATVNITVNSAIAYGNYAFERTITFKNAAVGISSNLTNFPVLVSVQSNDLIIANACGDKVQIPNGPNYDFAFVDPSASSSELYYQIESYNQTTGTLLVWVQIPTLYAASNNTLAFYYGSTAPTVTHNAAFFQKTWGSDYQAVYHFNEAAYTTTTADGTANGRNATLVGFQSTDYVAAGKIGSCYTFGGTSGSLTANDMEAAATPASTSFTLSAWINMNNTNLDQKVITNQNTSGTGCGGYKLGSYFGTAETEGIYTGDRNNTPNPASFSANTWYYVQGVYDGTTLSTYVNGVQYKQQAVSGSSAFTNTLYIGIGEGKTYPFSGMIDEPRVSNVAKSSDWIKMEYADQNNPTAFMTLSTNAVVNTTYAAPLKGALTYTWAGTSTDPTVGANWINSAAGTTGTAPAFDGTATLVIPSGLSQYPVLTSDMSVFGLTIGTGASLNLNGHMLNVGCNIYNNSTGTITANNSTASGINWNGTQLAQYYYGTTTSGSAQVGNMTVNNTNSNTGIVTITGGPLSVSNILTLTQGYLAVDNTGGGTLTLLSTATNTAAVAAIPATCKISGNVNVQRFISGGGSLSNRGYRILSSPVNQMQDAPAPVTSPNTFSLAYLFSHSFGGITYPGAFAGGPGGVANGFSGATTNPTIYFFKESRAHDNTGFTTGNNVGVSAITSTVVGSGAGSYTTTTETMSDGTTGVSTPVGNGFIMYFVGPSSRTDGSASLAPQDATLTSNGHLNQGSIPVKLWYNPTSGGNLSYTPGTASAHPYPGFNMVGNPYACAIDFTKVISENSGSIDNVYVLLGKNSPQQTYIAFTANGTSAPNQQGYAVSGEGFFVHVKSSAAATATLTFNETEKVPTVQILASNSVMSLAGTSKTVDGMKASGSHTTTDVNTPAQPALTGLYLKMVKDSATYNYCGIYYGDGWLSKFQDGDAIDYPGSTLVHVSSLSSDGVRSAVKHLPDYTKGNSRVKLYINAVSSGSYSMNIEGIRNIDTVNYRIFLIDHYKKDSVDIGKNKAYPFDITTTDSASYDTNRFVLAITRETPLAPDSLLAFTGQKVSTGIQLNWLMANEGNYTGFVLQKQNSMTKQFLQIYTKQSDGSGGYSYIDQSPITGNNVYRLQITDLTGKITYSNLVTVSYGQAVDNSNSISLYPNPAVATINVAVHSSIISPTSPRYEADIYNAVGNVMVKKAVNTVTWSQDVSNYIPGVYIVYMKDANGNIIGSTKFIKK